MYIILENHTAKQVPEEYQDCSVTNHTDDTCGRDDLQNCAEINSMPSSRHPR